MPTQLKNPWSISIAALSAVALAVYLFAPLFSIAVFGFHNGTEYIKAFWEAKRHMDAVTFLMPVAGAAGAVFCALKKGFGPHILTVAFSALPLMFMSYFIISICQYPDIITGTEETLPMVMVIGWGAWLALAAALLAFLAAAALVYTDYKSINSIKK